MGALPTPAGSYRSRGCRTANTTVPTGSANSAAIRKSLSPAHNRTMRTLQRRLVERLRGVHRRELSRLMRSVEEHRRVVADLITRPRSGHRRHSPTRWGWCSPQDVVAPLSLPGFDNSAMDGYAVVADDIAGASAEQPVLLPVAEDIPAGRTDPLTLKPGTAHRIMTGAPVPDRCHRRGSRRVHRRRDGHGRDPCDRENRPAHPPRRRGRHRRHHRVAGRAGRHAGGARSRRGTGTRRADGRSAAAGAGDVDRLRAGRTRGTR